MRNQLILAVAAVPDLKVADVEYNTNQIVRLIKENSACGLIVFPELSVTGYTCADLFGSGLLLEKAQDGMIRIAEATQEYSGLTVIIGVPIRFENNLYNCAAVISGGNVCAIIPKQYIPSYSEFYEGRWFSSGKGLTERSVRIHGKDIPFGTDILAEDPESGAVLGIEICEDLWVPDKPSTHMCLAGANIIANLSASDELIGKEEYRRRLVEHQSGSCCCAYVYASAGVDESSTDLVFSGHTLIGQCGTVLQEDIFPLCPSVSTGAIDLVRIMYDRRHQNTFGNADENMYRRVNVNIRAFRNGEASISEMADILKELPVVLSRNPFVPSDDRERRDRCRKIMRIQANGLATRIRATGIYNLLIGISGGLDSTLALLVCAEARSMVPEIRIIAYTMPNKGNTSGLTYKNARELMRLIADEVHEVPISESVQMHLKDIGHSPDYQGEGDSAYENAQARMRTYILMDAANMINGLVVGTGDLSELALGWCTYNGDHMSMYAVNASVPKTLVKYICRTYAQFCSSEELRRVIFAICDTPITPELTPSHEGKISQMTEEKIGKYDLNDFLLYYTVRYGFEPSRSAAYAMCAYPELERKEIIKAAERFYIRFFTQQFKRSCLPDGPKVGSVSLSPRGDWRMPSDASMRLWLDDLKDVMR